MTIKALLERNPHHVFTISPETRVGEAIALLAEKRIGALPVVRDQLCLGILSERDVIYGLQREGAALLDLAVEAVMTATPVSTELDRTVLSALALMTHRRIRHLPVMEAGRMVGFVSIGDLVKFRIDSIESEANAMRQYIQAS